MQVWQGKQLGTYNRRELNQIRIPAKVIAVQIKRVKVTVDPQKLSSTLDLNLMHTVWLCVCLRFIVSQVKTTRLSTERPPTHSHTHHTNAKSLVRGCSGVVRACNPKPKTRNPIPETRNPNKCAGCSSTDSLHIHDWRQKSVSELAVTFFPTSFPLVPPYSSNHTVCDLYIM